MDFFVSSITLVLKIVCGTLTILVIVYIGEMIIKLCLLPIMLAIQFIWHKKVTSKINNER